MQECKHEHAYLEAPCCGQGESGYVECACGGTYAIVCPDCGEEVDEETKKRVIEELESQDDYSE